MENIKNGENERERSNNADPAIDVLLMLWLITESTLRVNEFRRNILTIPMEVSKYEGEGDLRVIVKLQSMIGGWEVVTKIRIKRISISKHEGIKNHRRKI